MIRWGGKTTWTWCSGFAMLYWSSSGGISSDMMGLLAHPAGG